MGIFDIFSDKPARRAADAQIAGLDKGYGLAKDLYNTGRTDLTTNFGKAGDLYAGLQKSTGAGAGAYGDATGANGTEGLARARALFTATPGYTEGINMALDQNDRRQFARGMGASGNTIADTTKLATDYANQKYGDYAGRLMPYLGANQGAVAGGAGVYTGLGGALNANDVSQGQLGYQTQADIGKANANADLAKYGASKNIWDMITKLAGGAAGIAGGFPTGAGGAPGWAPSPNGPGAMSPMYGR